MSPLAWTFWRCLILYDQSPHLAAPSLNQIWTVLHCTTLAFSYTARWYDAEISALSRTTVLKSVFDALSCTVEYHDDMTDQLFATNVCQIVTVAKTKSQKI